MNLDTFFVDNLGINFGSIYVIARNEFKRVINHPLVIIIATILLLLALLNGTGLAHLLPSIEKSEQGKDIFILYGIGQIFYRFSDYFIIFSVFIGVLSIGEEQSKKSLSVLLSKPLYRRDIVAGKFLGISTFLLIFIILNFVVSSLLVMVFFRQPLSAVEYILRLSSGIVSLFFESMLVLSITMLIGIIFKDLLIALIVATTYLYVDSYSSIIRYLGDLSIISQKYLYITITSGASKFNLFDTSISYTNWLGTSLPYILLMLFEILAVLLINCIIFARYDER